MPSQQPDLSIYTRPAEILQKLIRFNTTNPPGEEAECIAYIRGLLTEAGIESTVLERTTKRPNLIARIQGAGKAPPLLLYGHVDVVTTENQKWEHAPFEGQLIDGFIWGRGALDMKGGVAMMLSGPPAQGRARAALIPLPCPHLTPIAPRRRLGPDVRGGPRS